MDDQVAARLVETPGLAVDGGLDRAEVEVQLVDFETRLGGFNGGLGLFLLGHVRVELLFADTCSLGSLGQLQIALVIRLGQLELGLVQADLGIGLIELSFVRPGVDLEKHRIFFDFRPFLEGGVIQEAGDACLHFRRLNGRGTAGILHVIGHLA